MPYHRHATEARVVITGIGLVTPLGPDRESSWHALRAGKSGARWLPQLRVGRDEPACGAPAALPETAATSVKGRSAEDGVAFRDSGAEAPSSPAPRNEPVVELALAATAEALDDAGLSSGALDPDDTGCVVGSSKGGFASFARAHRALDQRRIPHPSDWMGCPPSAAASAVAARYGLCGPVVCPVAACATGLIAVERAVHYLRDASCDCVLAGAADAALDPLALAAFSRMGVLARGFDDPARACRPYDARRNGFVVGEGAAVFVVERLERAAARGATIYAEWLAGGTAADGPDLYRLPDRPDTLAALVQRVLRRAGLAPDDLGYVNPHGTATLDNDPFETAALKHALGAPARRVPLSAAKSMIGHLLGAAGAVELAITLLAMRDGVVPPTINLEEPDPECDLDYTPLVARKCRIDTALKLSLGFGGHLVAAALRKVER